MHRLRWVLTTCLLVSHLPSRSSAKALFSCSHAFSSLRAELSGRETSLDLSAAPPPNPGPARDAVANTPLKPLDRMVPETGSKPVELVRIDGGPRPARGAVNEILGWKPGDYKVVLLAQEIDNTEPPPGSSAATRLGHQMLLRPAMKLGVFAERHLHVSVAYIDPEGNWFRANPTGPMAPIREGSFLNKDVVYLPLDLTAAQAERAAKGIRNAVGSRSPFGCANGSCQTVINAVDATEPAALRRPGVPITAGYTMARVLEGQLLPISNVYVSGTRVDSFKALSDGFDSADANVLMPFVLPVASAAFGGVVR